MLSGERPGASVPSRPGQIAHCCEVSARSAPPHPFYTIRALCGAVAIAPALMRGFTIGLWARRPRTPALRRAATQAPSEHLKSCPGKNAPSRNIASFVAEEVERTVMMLGPCDRSPPVHLRSEVPRRCPQGGEARPIGARKIVVTRPAGSADAYYATQNRADQILRPYSPKYLVLGRCAPLHHPTGQRN